MAKRREIRNSTAEFLIFQAEAKEQGVEVIYADETIWCTQKAMAVLFDVGIPAISKHLTNVFETGELSEEATISKMETVQHEGNRDVKRMVVMYKLIRKFERSAAQHPPCITRLALLFFNNLRRVGVLASLW